MAFSARSFTEPRSRSATSRSSAGQRPRGAVPFIGRVVRGVAVDPEEQLRRCRQHPVATQVEVAGVGAPLRVAQVAIQPALVALHLGAEPQRVVHLIGVAGRDVLVDRFDRAVVGLPVDGRPPRARAASARCRPAARGAPFPPGPRTSRTTRAAAARRHRRASARVRPARVEPRGGLVGDEARHPQPSCRRRLRRRRGSPGTSSGRVASSTPTGSTSRNDGSAPVRSSNRASITPGTIRGRAER